MAHQATTPKAKRSPKGSPRSRESSSSPPSVIASIYDDDMGWDESSQFTKIWDGAEDVVPSLATRGFMKPHEIHMANLGPGTKEAKGIYASTSRVVLSPVDIPKTVLIMAPRVKPCLKMASPRFDSEGSTRSLLYQPPKPVKLVRFSSKKAKSSKKKTISLTPEDVEMLWWTRSELKGIAVREAIAAKCFLLRCKTYPNSLERLLIECFASTGTTPGGCRIESGLSYEDALRDAVCINQRGVEQACMGRIDFPSVKHCHRIGKRCIAGVLKAQKRWKNISGATDEKREEMIASYQKNYSLFAGKFAQILAEGDALVAREIHGNLDAHDYEELDTRNLQDLDRLGRVTI